MLLTHPWWLSAVIGHLLAREGVVVEEVNVRGYGAIEWSGLSWAFEGNRIEADRIAVALPLTWLVTLYTGRPPAPPVLGEALVRLEDWSLDVDTAERERSDEPAPEVVLPELARQVHGILETVRRVMPTAVAKRGVVRAAPMEWTIAEASWRDGVFTVEGGETTLPGLARLTAKARLQPEGIALRARSLDDAWPWSVDAAVETGAQRLAARGSAEIDGLTLDGAVAWVSGGWVPGEAELTARGERIPATLAEHVPDWRLRRLDVAAAWSAPDAWTFTGSGEGEWREPENGEWIRWNGEAEASGDLETVRVEAASVDLPFLLADLSAPARFRFADFSLAEPVRVDVVADLSRFPVHPVDAGFEGSVSLDPVAEGGVWIDAAGALAGRWEGTDAAADVSLRGFVDAARAHAERLHLELPHGTRLEASGGYVFAEARVDGAEASFVLERADVEPFFAWAAELPARIGGAVTADGAWPDTVHEGAVQSADVTVPAMHPFDADLRWSGKGADFAAAVIGLRRGEHRIGAEAEVRMEDGNLHAVVGALFAEDGAGGRLFALAHEPVLSLEAAFGGEAGAWRVDWSAFAADLLSESLGEGRAGAEAGWFGAEGFSVSGFRVDNVDPAWITQWVDVELPEVYARLLALDAATDAEGRIEGAGTVDAEGVRGGERFGAGLSFALVEEGLRVADATAYRGGREVFRAEGALPLTLYWRDDAFAVELDTQRNLDFELRVDGRSELADLLATYAATEVDEPDIRLRLGGTLLAPTGGIEAAAGRVAYTLPDRDEPFVVRDLRLRVDLEDDRARIEEAVFVLPGVRESARLTGNVEGIAWDATLAGEIDTLVQGLRGEVVLDAFPFAALAGLLPDLFEARGSVAGDFHLSRGLNMQGEARVRGVSLRPFEDGSTLRDIDADVTLAGTVLEFRDMRALWNGRPVTMTGEADLSTLPDPLFSFEAMGERLDLVRRDDMLIRADVDVRIGKSSADAAPRIEGAVTMRNSLFLQDFRDILRPGAAGVEARPPYFSVGQAPFNEWELDVTLTGEDFMRIQSTLLRGRVSADFHLGGTLGEPLAIGDARLTNAAVLFPFGRIDLASAEALITLDQPHTLQLFAQGSGYTFGYTVNMLLRGTAARPVLELNSVPPLGQEAILMLLATGAVPDQDGDLASRSGRVALYFGQDLLSLLFAGEGGGNIRIRTGESSSQFGAASTGIEYIISDRYSVIGEYNEYENYSVDFKWRVFRR
ncbi:MAG: hypothetical protein JJU00_14470 [Opitutales bacterium]|nr:hypothetical protein [Opitutales bacterium]